MASIMDDAKRYRTSGEVLAVCLEAPYNTNHARTGSQQGESGDFLVMPRHGDLADAYVVRRDLFLATHEPVTDPKVDEDARKVGAGRRRGSA